MGPQPFGCGRLKKQIQKERDIAMLQWGRNLSVAEGDNPAPSQCRHCPASMGPQPFGCGRGDIAIDRRGMIWELQWGRNLSVAEGAMGESGAAAAVASMGPQPFGCGRLRTRLPLTLCLKLQWGRNLSVAEGEFEQIVLELRYRFNGAATFRLRKDGQALDCL